MKKTVLWLVRHLKHEGGLLLLTLICSLLYALASLRFPILQGEAVDLLVGVGGVDFNTLGKSLLQMVFCILTALFSQWALALLCNHVAYRLVGTLRMELFAKINRLPVSETDKMKPGVLVSRMMTDTEALGDGLLLTCSQFCSGIFTIIGILIVLFRSNLAIALFVLFLTPLSVFASGFITKKIAGTLRLQSDTRAKVTSFAEETVSLHTSVSAFRREETMKEAFSVQNEALKKVSLRATFFSSLVNPTTRFVNNLIYTGVAFLGGGYCLSGEMTVGALTAFLTYANRYTKPFNDISGVISELQNGLVSAGRIREILEREEEEEQSDEVGTVSGEIVFDDVSFSYTDAPFMEHLSFRIAPGEKIAVVGRTGCGKTTLVQLLMRFYQPTGGRILLDGKDISTLNRQSLRRAFGMVLQETRLKTATVKENLLFGRDISDEALKTALQDAHALEFVSAMEKGWDTPLRENGEGLSLGEKQLLSVARMMLSQSEVLLLDEATSSIDTRTEMQIQDAFARAMEGKTTVIIAHRLSTVQNADRIFVLENGKIAETGKHGELLEQNGVYASLYQSQHTTFN